MQRDAVLHVINQLIWLADREVVPDAEVCACRLCRAADHDGVRKQLRKLGRDMLYATDVAEDEPGARRMVEIMRVVEPIIDPR